MRTYSSFVGRRVETESGRSFGHCHDLRGELSGSSLEVKSLVVGRRGWLDHFGIASRQRARDAVAWDAIVRIEGDRIVVRDGTEVE